MYSLTGSALEDDDGDGRSNFHEYVLDGNPVNEGNRGVEPVFIKEGGAFEYIYKQRNKDQNLIYTVQTCADLVSGTWTSTGYTVTGTNVTGGTYNDVTNSIPTTGPQSYIRLTVTNLSG